MKAKVFLQASDEFVAYALERFLQIRSNPSVLLLNLLKELLTLYICA